MDTLVVQKKEIKNQILRSSMKAVMAVMVLAMIVLTSYGLANASELLHEVIRDSFDEHMANEHRSKLHVGGWSDFVYQDRDTDGYDQIFDPHHLYLFFDAQLDGHWRSYAEVEIEHVPDLKGSAAGKSSGEGELKVERLYIEYNASDELNVRVGKFNTPLGLWTPEHWAVNVPSVQKPIHEDNKYVPVKQVGLETFGSATFPFVDFLNYVNYVLWGSTGEDHFGTNKPTDNQFAYGVDFNLALRETVKVGLSGYFQHNSAKSSRKEKTFMPYAELYLPQELTVTGEYLHQSRDSGFSNIGTWYASLKWQLLPDTYIYYRMDKGDDEERGAGSSHQGQVLTLGYWPRPFVRTKLEFSKHDFDASSKENFNQWNAWIGVIF